MTNPGLGDINILKKSRSIYPDPCGGSMRFWSSPIGTEIGTLPLWINQGCIWIIPAYTGYTSGKNQNLVVINSIVTFGHVQCGFITSAHNLYTHHWTHRAWHSFSSCAKERPERPVVRDARDARCEKRLDSKWKAIYREKSPILHG